MKKNILVRCVIITSALLITGCSNNVSNATEKKAEVTQTNTMTPSPTKIPVAPVAPIAPIAPVTPTNVTAAEVGKIVKPTAAVVATVAPKKVEPSSIPTANNSQKIIVIDPGHANKSNLNTEALAPGSSEMKIKDGGGAEGVVTKTPEYLVNMNVAMKLKSLLEQKGFKVVMTKTDNSVSLGNIDRANVGNNVNANLVIRIHADSSDNGSVTGASMLVPAGINTDTKRIQAESNRCGNIILNTLTSEVGIKNRGVTEHSDMTGFNWSKVPVVLVEMGFLSNVNEDKLLSSEDYESKLAQALFDGIVICEK